MKNKPTTDPPVATTSAPAVSWFAVGSQKSKERKKRKFQKSKEKKKKIHLLFL